MALLLLASLFACDKDKNEPQGAKIESISFKQESYSVEEYQTDGINLKSELSIVPAAIADTCKITWALTNTDVASIDKDGIITPKKVGETTVTATVQGKSAQCKYTVKETTITKIYLTNAGVKVGSKVTLLYSTKPIMVPAERLTWSSEDTDIATVNEKGEVTGVKAGRVEIWAQCGTVKEYCSVTVSNVPVESVVIEPATATIAKGETKQFSAHVLPEEAETESLVYTWKSSNTSVATVDNKGLVTSKAVGESDITVTVKGKSATSKLTVKDNVIHVTSVSVDPSTISENVSVGSSKQLSAIVLPSNATDKTVTWTSSNTAVATVTNQGAVICQGEGEATITATADGKSGTCKVKYTKVHVTSVSVSPSTWSADLIYGASVPTKQLSATVYPSTATDKTVTWTSSNTNVATVSSSGLVTCKGIGEATITATADSKSGTCTVSFNKVPVSSVSVSPSTYTAEGVVGSTKQLSATVSPVTATLKKVTWKSSNTAVATVDNNGLVTCKGTGSATITATADGKSGTCAITYTQSVIRVQSVTMSQTSATLLSVATAGGEGIGILSLDATVKPSNATYKTVTWKSSNTSVAIVDGYGVVIAKAEGTTTITATADGKSATCAITVKPGAYIVDRENNEYLTVKIGNQWWMAENLRCGSYDTQSERPSAHLSGSYNSSGDGDDPYYLDTRVTSNWGSSNKAGYLSSDQKKRLGYLYSWAAAVGIANGETARNTSSFIGNRQGICPNGWHLPTYSEWNTLISTVGGEETAGEKLKTTSGWYTTSSSFNSNGTDEYFFSLLPSGSGVGGTISNIGEEAYFWTATSDTYGLEFAKNMIFTWGVKYSSWQTSGKNNLHAVRCVK